MFTKKHYNLLNKEDSDFKRFKELFETNKLYFDAVRGSDVHFEEHNISNDTYGINKIMLVDFMLEQGKSFIEIEEAFSIYLAGGKLPPEEDEAFNYIKCLQENQHLNSVIKPDDEPLTDGLNF